MNRKTILKKNWTENIFNTDTKKLYLQNKTINLKMMTAVFQKK